MITRSKLQKLSEDCGKLLFCSEKIEGNNTKELIECNRAIKQALRKIIIANEISDRMIICVTGLQGTGKTSLMKNYYDIDDSIMNIALGRGERLPVLITEADISDFEMYAVGIEKTEDSYAPKRECVSTEDFIEFSKGEDEDSTIMYVELLVPRKYVNKHTKVSYMLLPGYERKDSYWNTLIEFSVRCADTAIFVLTPESVASANNAQLLQKMKEIFGENVIYAISHSDETDDRNQKIKATLMELVGADSTREQSFVCTGAYTNFEENEKWKKELRTAIETFAANPYAMDQRNTEYMESIIASELRPAVVTIKRYVTDVTEELLTGFENSSWLSSFDSEAARMRKKFQKSLSDEFKNAQSKDKEDLLAIMQYGKKINKTEYAAGENSVSGKVKDFLDASKSKLGYLRRNIFGESLKDVENGYKLIAEAMQNEEGVYRYKEAFANALTKRTDELCATVESDGAPKIGIANQKTVLLSKPEEERGLILRDINTILTVGSEKNELVSAKSHETMKAMVECGTQYFCLQLVSDMHATRNVAVPALAKSNLSQEDIALSVRDTEKFAVAVLGVTGLDILGDGVINVVPALAEVLSISVPVAGALVAGIVGVGAAKALISDYNKLQLKDYYSYGKAIASVYEEVEKRYLDAYDDYIAEIRYRVERYLAECVGADRTVFDKQNALVAIKNIQEDLDEIREELKDSSYDTVKVVRG